MTDQSLQFPRFFVTAPSPCPYLPGRQERKVFTELRGPGADSLNEALSRVGFRRSQSVAYRPACEGCAACISVRVIASRFRPTRSMRRVLRTNRDVAATVLDPAVTREQFDLLKHYLDDRHAEGGMADMDLGEYTEMVEHTPVRTQMIEYRLPSPCGPGRLIAACLTDEMSDGLSMVYSFYDPRAQARSLGTYLILHHIDMAVRRGLRYVFLGYWIEGSRKMAYKTRFRPLERLTPQGWVAMADPRDQPASSD
ncbi:MAG: arginyltransferase [Alphaproteobacteria bacterium]|nr:MAG: arginyltransferase [Alphaproteobacteria bacterium]